MKNESRLHGDATFQEVLWCQTLPLLYSPLSPLSLHHSPILSLHSAMQLERSLNSSPLPRASVITSETEVWSTSRECYRNYISLQSDFNPLHKYSSFLTTPGSWVVWAKLSIQQVSGNQIATWLLSRFFRSCFDGSTHRFQGFRSGTSPVLSSSNLCIVEFSYPSQADQPPAWLRPMSCSNW